MSDGTRYVVLVKAHGTDTVHSIHREAAGARRVATDLLAHGFPARVAEGRQPTAPTFTAWGKRGRRA